jgi:hypothetical protein
MAMAGIDLLERAWLELAATNLPRQTPRPEHPLDDELPPCALCGWADAMAFKGTVVCVRCRTQLLDDVTPTAPVAHDELGRFDTVSAPTPARAPRPARRP